MPKHRESPIKKVGNTWWIDMYIAGRRIRRSLKTENRLEALNKAPEKIKDLTKQYSEKKIRFDDFCKQYIDWAWDEKPASTQREEQRLEKGADIASAADLLGHSKYTTTLLYTHTDQEKKKKAVRLLN